MELQPRTVRNGTEQRGTTMIQKHVLVIGTLEMRSNDFEKHNHHVTVTANYVEAIERLKKQAFDFVITDADATCKICCLEFLRHIKSHFINRDERFSFMYVCHTQRKLRIRGTDWIIYPSLKAYYPFASYFEGTVWACMNQILLPQQKRA